MAQGILPPGTGVLVFAWDTVAEEGNVAFATNTPKQCIPQLLDNLESFVQNCRAGNCKFPEEQ